uniref:class F sortase n=1 Tax=Streptomyces ipomoeae TaxID=103232 RepID=UPI0035A67730
MYFTPPSARPSPTTPSPAPSASSAPSRRASSPATPGGKAGARGAAPADPRSSTAGSAGPGTSGTARPGAAKPKASDATATARSTSGKPASSAGPAQPAKPARPAPLPPSPPKTLAIPYLGIKAPVMGLQLDRERRLPAPPDDKPELVGWYSAGPAPGGPGTAVVVGHRDTRTGPAVFAALEMIKPGRIVEVRRADGRIAVYTVDAVRTYEKSRFPDEVVYGLRNRPELRLITCGGTYDRRKGYASNVVVFAHLTATRGPRAEGR